MITATKEYLNEIEALSEKLKQEILNAPDCLEIKGTAYYVSNDGCDDNDGLSAEAPWKTLVKASEADLKEGDGVLFRRGDLFRGKVATKPGVSYGAYGVGEKPKLYGSDKNLADPALWTLWDAEHRIWKLNEKVLDPGTLVFNDGEYHSYKLIPTYREGMFVCRNDESKLFDMREEMVRDLDIFWDFDDILTTNPSKGEDFPIPDMTPQSFGELYLRCDRGNPGGAFKSIETTPRRAMMCVGGNNNVHIDNLCLKYIGIHAVAAGGERNRGLHVTNCEIGWIGGTIQTYMGTDPNYPEGRRGSVTRFGNAVEIYGGCDDYKVSNCYIYECYDAGITHQVTTGGKTRLMTDITYKDNLIEKCVYGIEYFLDMTKGDTESYMDGVEMCGNIIRESGYGWGQQRHNTHTPAAIKGWSYINKARNYTVHHNIFDRAAYRMVHLVAKEQASCPDMHDNTYIQFFGNMIGQYGGNEVKEPDIEMFDENAEKKITEIFGDRNAKVVVIK